MVTYLLTVALIVAFMLVFFRLIRIVPEQEAWVVEQLGRYRKTMGPGLHLVVPLVQRVAYRHTLKEEVINVSPQICITRDNVQVTVDGLLYLKVVDAVKASYGIEDYRFATMQLAQTTMRSEIGKIDLDNTFSERDAINNSIVRSVDEASEPWGVKVTRYEIRDISPPDTILQAMEQQMRAEREKRSEILRSEGERESRINVSRGEREEAINLSRGERQRRINEAEGRARAIALVAEATAEGIGDIAAAIRLQKGRQASALRIAENFLAQLGRILESSDTEILPLETAQLRALVQAALGAAPAGKEGEAS